MRGLLINNFYGIAENVKIFIGVIVFAGVIFSILGDTSMVSVFAFIPAPVMAILAVSCLRKESASRWCQYKCTLPVRRKDIVKSQYISHAVCGAAGCAAVALFLTVSVLIHGNVDFYYGFRDAVTLVLGGGILAFLIGAVAYPLYYWWGEERAEIAMVLAVLGAAGIVVALSMLANVIVQGETVSDFTYYVSLVIILVVTVAAYMGSYAISAMIYKKVER